jgi:hypothetical protein
MNLDDVPGFESEDRVGRRQHPRNQVPQTCAVRHINGSWTQTVIHDVSPEGCRIAPFHDCRPGERVFIRIAGLSLLVGTTCWERGNVIGCHFEHPLHEAVLDHLLTQDSGQPERRRGSRFRC